MTCLESGVIAANDLVNEAILLCLKRRHIPVPVSVLVNLGSRTSVSSCLSIWYLQEAAKELAIMLSRQHIMNEGLSEDVTFSMGCPVHSDMILFKFAL